MIGNLGDDRGYREGAALMGGEYIWGRYEHGARRRVLKYKTLRPFFLLRRTTPISPGSPKRIPGTPIQKYLYL